MATAEEVRQELNDAKVQLQEAKDEVKEFKEGADGQWLEVLKERLRGEGGTAAQRAEWKEERTQLEERQKSLEKDRRDRLEQVEKLQDRLTAATTQPGNDFVTRALGT